MHFIVPDIGNQNVCLVEAMLQWFKYSSVQNSLTLYTVKVAAFKND